MVEVKDASDLASLKTGEQVFAAQCTACHTAGALGAPKLGDAAAWAPRIKTGFDALLHSALAGKGQMPPQGGGDFSDFEIARAVVYMANKAGAKFAEPAAPSAARLGARQRPPTASAAPTADAERRQAGAPTPCPATRRRRSLPPPRRAAAHRRGGRDDRGRRRGAAALRPDLQPSATPPASPARPRSATRRPGRRASPRASTR